MPNQRQSTSNQSDPNTELLELQSILENIDRGFMAVDRNWCIVYVNARAVRDVRRKPDELVGKNFWAEFPELEGTNSAKIYRKAMNERRSVEIEGYSAMTGCWNQQKAFPTVNGIVIAWADITERKKTEEALMESEERFSKAFRNNPAAMAISNIDGQIVDVNESFEQLMGYTKDEIIGKIGCDIGLYTVSEREKLIEQLNEKGRVSNFELTFRHKSGNQIDVLFSLESITLNKEPYLLGIAIDNTERKKAEEAHRISEERLQNIINAMDDGIVLIGLDGKVIDCNQATLKQFNMKREEVLGKVVMDYMYSENRENFLKETQDMLRKTGKARVETQLLRKNSSPLSVEVSLTRFYDKDKKPSGLLGVARDITERKKAQDELREAEEKFRGLVESTSDMIWQVDEKAVYTYVSPKIKDILGYEPEEIVGRTPFDLIDEQDEHKIIDAFLEIANKKEAFHGLENCNIHKNGSRVLLETSGVPILDETGQLLGYRGIDRDITERKKVEESLRQSEERFSKAFQATATAMAISRLDGTYVDINGSFESLTGFTQKEVVGKTAIELCLYAEPTERLKLIQQLKNTGKVFGHEITLQSKNGQLKNVLLSFEIIKLNDEPHILSSAIDITERKKSEQALIQRTTQLEQTQKKLEEYANQMEKLAEQRAQQLQEKERLAAIGQTAGMVGHDIRNPLQAMISDVYLLKDSLINMPNIAAKPEITESLDGIEKNISYINKIVADLQDYARPVTPECVDLKLYELVTSVFAPIEIPNNITVSIDIEATVSLKSDPTLLRRIITNLIVNGLQAMPGGGKLTVNGCPLNKSFLIVIEDTGVGIPEHVKDKLFTPMMTTKSKGQGLGLAVVKRLVEALNGTISFESQEGKGTKFTVELPTK
jgi:PAS domain S-box-containing protein